MKASIIITTYNRPEFLSRAIISALEQNTSHSFEVIVVDDNGKDTVTQKDTEKLIEQFSEVHYLILEENSGACVARNEGAKIAKGEFLFFLDDDDAFLPNKVEIQINYLEIYIEYSGVLAGFIRIDEDGREIISESNQAVVGDFKNFVLRGNFFTPMLCIRRKDFLQSGGFIDIPRFQDRFYLMNTLKKEFTFGVLAESLHIMYEHQNSRISSSTIEKTEKALKQIEGFLQTYREEFLIKEWKQLKLKHLNEKAVSYYISEENKIRRKAILKYGQIFFNTTKYNDLKMIFKSLIKSIL